MISALLYLCLLNYFAGNFFAKNDEFIFQAANKAKLDIERAINATLNNLFTRRNNTKSPEFLMKLFRYPDEHARNILKPAEIYSRTLSNVRRHILSGLKLNISGGTKKLKFFHLLF